MQVTRTSFREDHEQFRTTVRRFLERECVPHMNDWHKAGRVPRELWLKAGKEGLLCPTLPEQYGGGGGDYGHAAVLTEEMGALGITGVGFGLHSDIIAPCLHRLGTEEQKAKWLPRWTPWCSCTAATATCSSTRWPEPSLTCGSSASTAARARCSGS